MKIYITPGTNLAQDVYEIFLKCSLFTNQVTHLREILKTLMRLVGSYYYYLVLVTLQVLCVVPVRLGPSCQEPTTDRPGKDLGKFFPEIRLWLMARYPWKPRKE